ncbi:SDR family NAD(P)-dependent oxidoreductase [Streptomyces griseoflavus]|uniref:SDR family NAD(P)-dependent oxidoreductase n=1 Tax=Streptomyces griseoflavus TaxID=35619 RepID=UPI003D73756C
MGAGRETAGPGRVAVVGGGVAGIAAVKALIEAGVEVFGLERAGELGGLWRLSDDTAAYEGLRLNTSKPRTEFSDHPMPPEWPDYPSRAQLLAYVQEYAERFGVPEHYRMHTELVAARRTGEGWLLALDGPDGPYEEAVAHLVVANGHNHTPRLPEPPYPGTFAGTSSHAHAYREPAEFAGRRVLVVGTGNSAMDIATELAGRASEVLISARRGVWVLPKRLLGRPTDQWNGALAAVLPWRLRQRVSQAMLRLAGRGGKGPALPPSPEGVLQDHPTLSDTVPALVAAGRIGVRTGIERFEGRRVRFTDGREDEVDHVLWCTGYRATVPFLDPELVPDPARLPLYRHVFPLDEPALSFVGLMQSTGSALPVVEAQGRLLAAHLSGRLRRPHRDRMLAAVTSELHAARDRWGTKRPHMRIDVDRYLRQVARDLAERRGTASSLAVERRGTASSLAGRRVIVTGAAGTFGRALGDRFTALGARVVGLDLVADETAPVPVVGCDLTDPESVTKGVEEAVRLLGGGVDVLVNNAGRGGPAPAELRPSEEVHTQLRLNLLGAWEVTAAALPHLERARGRVVFVASRMALLPLPLAAAYGVSKRALAAYADTLRLEVGTHVGVTTVYPSMVRSPIHDSTREAGLSLDGVSRPEPLEGVVSAVVSAVTALRAPRDVATTRRGRAEMALARHAPALTDRIVRRTVASRLAAGAFAKAPLAEGLRRRHGRDG